MTRKKTRIGLSLPLQYFKVVIFIKHPSAEGPAIALTSKCHLSVDPIKYLIKYH